ncbi:MAG: bifunctional hydroxymethylpyrimidine kinase/phosphomethylpyrimidine kinase [Muribaculaceae bacterium]|nr:bifunctional hydroxymethylpyrimidine kinase/phosphomethylpyrimidine kinase [Muribaculaceae bacterium]
MQLTYRTMLSVAGSDPTGGAGILADVKTATALGVYGMAAITAVTSQNTMGVSGYEAVSPDLLRAQLHDVVSDIRPDAVKTGMIPTRRHVEIIAETIAGFGLDNVVIDPVAVATSGDSLATPDALLAAVNHLFPLATLVTPNLPEASMILGRRVEETDAADAGLEIIGRTGVKAVLVKGGHGNGAMLTDTLVERDGNVTLFTLQRIDTRNTHGTGCTLSSAIASMLARGMTVREAVKAGAEWLHRAIEAGSRYRTGHGNGPVNHLQDILK